MSYLTRKHDTAALVEGPFNRLVAELLTGQYPFVFDPPAPDQEFKAVYKLDVTEMFPRYHMQMHMAQSYFAHFGELPPSIPITLKLNRGIFPFPPGMVISPFSWSDKGGNKMWPHERWRDLITRLRDAGLVDTVYLLGSRMPYGSQLYDEVEAYRYLDVVPVLDRPLSQVLDLMLKAPVVVSIDNGISHLAHYGGILNHVLLYPGILPACWVPNPRASTVNRGNPTSVTVDDMLHAILPFLKGANDGGARGLHRVHELGSVAAQ